MSLTFKLPNRKILSSKYKDICHLYERLIEEIIFILKKTINEQNIKIHGIQDRIKKFDSFYNKINRKQIQGNPFEKINDIAGIRIICLYRSDLEKIGKLISEHFQVIEADIKTKTIIATEFGYMSDQFIITLPKEFSGTRYDNIKSLKCEIQVRTILMDAWDSVSHHLVYKQEIDIPSHLRRDFYALSGLFYVADTHFEMFKDSITKVKMELIDIVSKKEFNLDLEMNFDTIITYLEWKFPEREVGINYNYSELLYHLYITDYLNFRKLNIAIDKGINEAETQEKKLIPTSEEKIIIYHRVAIVRKCLEIVDPNFHKKYYINKYPQARPKI